MQQPDVTVVDYGVGNLLSVEKALAFGGALVLVTSDPSRVRDARRVVLPGVGAFANGMEQLRRLGLDEALRDVAAAGRPLLGICLGMQMMFEESEEFGTTEGLGLIPGKVVAIPAIDSRGVSQKIPHIGWNGLLAAERAMSWADSVLDQTEAGEELYFVHSYMAVPLARRNLVAECDYGGHRICAVAVQDNVHACQFHPEKSGKAGLGILQRFIQL